MSQWFAWEWALGVFLVLGTAEWVIRPRLRAHIARRRAKRGELAAAREKYVVLGRELDRAIFNFIRDLDPNDARQHLEVNSSFECFRERRGRDPAQIIPRIGIDIRYAGYIAPESIEDRARLEAAEFIRRHKVRVRLSYHLKTLPRRES